MNDLAPIIIGIVIVVVVGGAVWSYVSAQKRREAMSVWAQSIGATFVPAKDWGLNDRFPQFSHLQDGNNQYGYNIVEGRAGERPMCAFDYHYETYSRDSKGRRRTHHHYFSGVIMDTHLPLQPLFIRPEGFFDKVTEFLGFDDIDFELNEFSRKFYVKASDKKWAFDVIHQETMEFLLANPTFNIQFADRHVMAWRGATFDVPEFIEAIGVLGGILDRLPGYLVQELKGIQT